MGADVNWWWPQQVERNIECHWSPSDDKEKFIGTERDIGETWRCALKQSMMEAGQREREIAIQKGNFHEGVPTITVIVDGGWSKRVHKHSYNAKSGVAIIIGEETGNILFIGVRNKFCQSCAMNIPQDKHVCFKNWCASSSEMKPIYFWKVLWRLKECTDSVI